MRSLTLAVLALGIGTVLADKWSDLKTQSYLEKKKRHRNLEEAKADIESFKKKGTFEKASKKKKYGAETTTEKFLKDERWQLCQSVDQDDVKNTLLKFGLVTHLFDDIQKFRKSMKSLQDQIPRTDKKKKKRKPGGVHAEKEMIREKGGPTVKLSQSNWVGRALGLGYLPASPSQADYGSLPQALHREASNTIGGGRERRSRDTMHRERWRRDTMHRERRSRDTMDRERWRRDTMHKNNLRGRRKGTLKVPGQVPQCFGWKYLAALDVLSDSHAVDAEVLAESVSDMLDTNFSKAVSDILETCGERVSAGGTDLCPPPKDPVEGEEACDSQCLVNDECQFREICCKASCGGFRCLSTTSPGKGNPCKMADQFMQCVYQMINNNQLCPNK